MSIQFTMALRYLWGRKLRMFLTSLAISFGVMVLFGLNAMIPSMMNAFNRTMMTSAGQVSLAVAHVTGNTFAADRLGVVQTLPGVASAVGILQKNVNLPISMGGSVDAATGVAAIDVVGADPDSVQAVRAYAVAEGRFLQAGTNGEAVVSKTLAQKLDLAPGSTLMLPSSTGTAEFKVVGVLEAGLTLTDQAIITLPDAEALFNLPGQINSIEMMFAAGVDEAEVKANVLAALGPDFEQAGEDAASELAASIQLGEAAFGIFGFMALAMGGFIIFNTFRTIIAERRRDLGMLRAVGASRRTVLGIILSESLIQGVAGTLLGLIMGYGMAYGFMAIVSDMTRSLMRIEIGAPIITPGTLITAVSLGVGMTVLSALYPALTATRVSPLEAMRPSVGVSELRKAQRRAVIGVGLIIISALGLIFGSFELSGISTLVFFVGLVLIAPALVYPVARYLGGLLRLTFKSEGQIAGGNLKRQPSRAAVTASAMMIGLAIVIALAGLVDSIRAGFFTYLDRSLGADFLIMPPSLVLGGGNLGAAPDLSDELRAVDGVGMVTTLRLAASQINGTNLQLIGLEPQTYGQVSGLEFSKGNADEAYAALEKGNAMIVNGIFSTTYGVKLGDKITLKTPEGDQPFEVVGVGLDYLNAKLATGYISQADMERYFHQTSDVLLMANAAPGADKAAAGTAINNLLKQYPSFSLVDATSFKTSQSKMFNAAMSFMYVLMLVLALPGLIAMINTLTISVLERTREIGLLRAVGSTRKQVRRMVLAESLLLAGLGTLLGVVVGIWLGYVLVNAMNFSGFKVDYYFPYTGVIIGVVVGLLFGVLAASLPARQAEQMDVVTALRYE